MPRRGPKLDPVTLDFVHEGNRPVQYTTEEEEHLLEAQEAAIELRTGQGAWAWDTLFGLPYVQRLLADSVPESEAEVIVRATLLARPGIRSVDFLEVTRDRRTKLLHLVAEITTRTSAQARLTT